MKVLTNKPTQTRRPDVIIVKTKKSCQIVYFAVPADHGVNIKETETRIKYTELAKELKEYKGSQDEINNHRNTRNNRENLRNKNERNWNRGYG